MEVERLTSTERAAMLASMGKHLDAFLSYAESEAPKLHKRLDRLRDEPVLEALLGMLASQKAVGEHTLAHRMLAKLHKPSAKGLALLYQSLLMLGLTPDGSSDADIDMANEIVELFCKSDSVNDTLSNKELELLISVLAKLDTDGNGVLDESERSVLRDGLWTPDEFLAELLET